MEKLAQEMIALFQELLAAHERQLSLAQARQAAMRAYDMPSLSGLLEREEIESRNIERLDLKRKDLVSRLRRVLGIEPNASAVASKVAEPFKSQLLGLAAKLRMTLEQIERINRTNAKISQAVITSLSKVLKIITGVAQHVGLYTRAGRKATLAGIHMLEITA
jgi:flagellar biosynthesis/type III secretory pathway chaperone